MWLFLYDGDKGLIGIWLMICLDNNIWYILFKFIYIDIIYELYGKNFIKFQFPAFLHIHKCMLLPVNPTIYKSPVKYFY